MVEKNQNEVQSANTQELKEINLTQMSDRKIGESVEKPNLDGQTVSITDVSLKETNEERTTQDGTKKQKTVIFSIEYDGIHRENYGGVTSFIYDDGNTGEPTIWPEGKSAAAVLFNKWLKFVGKEVGDVSFKEFFVGLKGMTAQIVNVPVYYQDEEFRKNIVDSFVDGVKTPSQPIKEQHPNTTPTKQEKCPECNLTGVCVDTSNEPHKQMEEYWNKTYTAEDIINEDEQK